MNESDGGIEECDVMDRGFGRIVDSLRMREPYGDVDRGGGDCGR